MVLRSCVSVGRRYKTITGVATKNLPQGLFCICGRCKLAMSFKDIIELTLLFRFIKGFNLLLDFFA